MLLVFLLLTVSKGSLANWKCNVHHTLCSSSGISLCVWLDGQSNGTEFQDEIYITGKGKVVCS